MHRGRARTARTLQLRSERSYGTDDVKAALAQSPIASGFAAWFLDKRYWALSQADWDLVLRENEVDRLKWRTDRFDCDDFSVALRGWVAREHRINGVALVLDNSSGHMYVACLVRRSDDSLQVRCLEPQSDKWIDAPDKKLHRMHNGVVIF